MSDLKAIALSSLILFLKHIVTIGVQGKMKANAGMRPPEDTSLGLSTLQQNYDNSQATNEARIQDIRWKQIVLNDLENIPFALITFIISYLATVDKTLTTTLISIFTAARVCHTISYAYSLQPWRSIFFFVGIIPVFVATIANVAYQF